MCLTLATLDGYTEYYHSYCQTVNNVYVVDDTEDDKLTNVTESILVCQFSSSLIPLGRGKNLLDVMEYSYDGDGDLQPYENREGLLKGL